jgi:hypothetical protein
MAGAICSVVAKLCSYRVRDISPYGVTMANLHCPLDTGPQNNSSPTYFTETGSSYEWSPADEKDFWNSVKTLPPDEVPAHWAELGR